MPEQLHKQYVKLNDEQKKKLNIRIQQLQNIEQPRIRVGIMGNTNVGKSSLIHALLNIPRGQNPRVGADAGVTRAGERFVLEGLIEIVDLPGFSIPVAAPIVVRIVHWLL